MANLLERMTPERDAPEKEVCQVKLVNGSRSKNFDLVGKLRDGSLAYAGSKTISVAASERPWVETKAQERALTLARQMEVDYVLVESAGGDLHNYNHFLAQFYVEKTR